MKRILFVLLVLISFPAMAEEQKLNLALKYDATWSGFNVGELIVRLSNDGEKYNYSVKINSKGPVRMISKYWSDNRIEGNYAAGKHIPQKYNTEWRRKKERQKIQVNYDAKGNAIEEIATPPEDRGRRPFVEPKDKKGAYDIITAAVAAREEIMKAAKSGNFPAKVSVPAFDARRRQEINIIVTRYETQKIDGKDRKLLKIKFDRAPGPGFSEKEIDKMTKQEPRFEMQLDENFIPLTITGISKQGIAYAKLVKICPIPDCKMDD